MRGTVINLLMILLTAGCGVVLCLSLGRDPHPRELSAAAIAVLVASQLALVPVFVTRRGNQIAAAQAALIATMIHLMLAATFAAVVVLAKLPLGRAFVYWLLAFYWMTLTGLVVTVARHIRLAPITPATKA
jgi:hypothetical protein